MYEELMSHEETRRALELPLYFAVMPAFQSIYKNIAYNYEDIQSKHVDNPYHSANESPLSKDALRQFLIDNQLIHEDPNECKHPEERYWP
jgi:hypothetical protein